MPKVVLDEAAFICFHPKNNSAFTLKCPASVRMCALLISLSPRNSFDPSDRFPNSSPSAEAQSANGRKAAEFVSEDDVRRAIQKGEKIYVGPRTIITPSARDIGDPAEVFAKV